MFGDCSAGRAKSLISDLGGELGQRLSWCVVQLQDVSRCRAVREPHWAVCALGDLRVSD